ncbi:MAG: LysE family transporter [Myxococcales bacterium]|nr:LysE family transporter [Myxococcales bacterium]
MFVALLIGFCFGFFGSIPVAGPIAALVLSRGLTGRFTSAALIGVGGAVAEALYAFLAFWGFSTYLTRYPWIDPVSRSVAAVILVGLGISFTRYHGAREAPKKEADSHAKSVMLGFSITALNPTLIATWTAATTTLYSADIVRLEPGSALPFALGALLGIGGWFSLLTALLRRYRGRFDQKKLELFVRGIGVLILLLGLWFGYKAVRYFVG